MEWYVRYLTSEYDSICSEKEMICDIVPHAIAEIIVRKHNESLTERPA